MTNEISQLKEQVFATDSPSRSLIVRYFKTLASAAKQLPVSDRDDLAYEILRPFVELNNPPEDDPALEYIVFQLAGGNLDVLREDGIATLSIVDQLNDRKFKEAVWTELIERIERLELRPEANPRSADTT